MSGKTFSNAFQVEFQVEPADRTFYVAVVNVIYLFISHILTSERDVVLTP